VKLGRQSNALGRAAVPEQRKTPPPLSPLVTVAGSFGRQRQGEEQCRAHPILSLPHGCAAAGVLDYRMEELSGVLHSQHTSPP
jgi:hypothetical protein